MTMNADRASDVRRVFVSTCEIQVSNFDKAKRRFIAGFDRAYWPATSQTNSPTVTLFIKSLYFHICFKLQLKMPANQVTVSKLEAVLARLEVVADKLGATESSVKKGSAQADIQSLVERLETAAGKLEQIQSASTGEGES